MPMTMSVPTTRSLDDWFRFGHLFHQEFIFMRLKGKWIIHFVVASNSLLVELELLLIHDVDVSWEILFVYHKFLCGSLFLFGCLVIKDWLRFWAEFISRVNFALIYVDLLVFGFFNRSFLCFTKEVVLLLCSILSKVSILFALLHRCNCSLIISSIVEFVFNSLYILVFRFLPDCLGWIESSISIWTTLEIFLLDSSVNLKLIYWTLLVLHSIDPSTFACVHFNSLSRASMYKVPLIPMNLWSHLAGS